ncbi:MAG: VWA domain-containing protein [Rhodanobacteraceae bacterium]|nr:VWA domain-containing protein [Rhodanobacteraceae bacterium]
MDLNLAEFQFLRPWWLAALPLLLLLLWVWRHRRAEPGAWQRAVDPHLLPHLLQRVEVRGTRLPSVLAMLVGTLAIMALAGPSWRVQPQPLWQREAPLVIALDLSAAIRATDLKPSRLAQARAKIDRLLAQRSGGQVGLLAYAGHAFTVAPITRDARTVQALLDSLSPDVMPVEGQRVDRAIAHALKLLRAADATRGEILLLSDRSDAAGEQAAAQARVGGFRVSVIGVGTLAGAPLSGRNGFIVGADGQPQLARLDPASLAALAAAGGGRYAPLSADDSDLAGLGVLDTDGAPMATGGGEGEDSDAASAGNQRSDDGYWLLLVLLPLVLAGFRRGWLALLPLTLVLALSCEPRAAYADANTNTNTNTNTSSFWDSLWRRADQRAHAALQAGDAASARALAPDAGLRAAAAYREKDYVAAADSWSGIDSADAHYNRGNALAQAGKLNEALDAYAAALAQSPGMEDAIANRKAVEDLLKQQQSQPQKSGQQDGQKQQGEQQQGEQQQGEQQQGEQQQGEQQQGEQQQGEQQQGEQKQGERQQGEQQQGEQQQGEQQQGEQQQGEQQQGEQQQGEQQQGEQQQGEQQQGAMQSDDADRQAAEEAARREMQQALEAREGEEATAEAAQAVELTPEQRAEMEKRQAHEQLLRRVPDDPGALLRRKFELEYQRRIREGEDR